jgi:hypothetical protein
MIKVKPKKFRAYKSEGRELKQKTMSGSANGRPAICGLTSVGFSPSWLHFRERTLRNQKRIAEFFPLQLPVVSQKIPWSHKKSRGVTKTKTKS